MVVEYIASLLLKLEGVHNVCVRCIDELVDDLHFIAASASATVIRDIVVAHLKTQKQTLDDAFVTSLVEDLCKFNPLSTALAASGPLSSSFRRKQYYKERFEVVEPVEYILEATEKRSYQHIPILQSLVQVLDTEHVREKVLNQDLGLSSSA